MFLWMRKRVSGFISWFIPMTTKKMVVLTSASTILMRDDGGHNSEDQYNKLVSELNERLTLATQQNSMLFAIEVGKILWRDLKMKYAQGKIDRIVLAEAIYDDCPTSLRYADRNKMVGDIISAIEVAESYA